MLGPKSLCIVGNHSTHIVGIDSLTFILAQMGIYRFISRSWGDNPAMLLKDEQGMMAIGVALMLIVVLSLFGGALWQYSMAELKRVDRTEQDLQALFLARAGAEMVMGAWRQEISSDQRPFGKMDPIYYDLDNESFVTTKPQNYLGPIEVEISREEESEELRDPPTEITATAHVGSTSRTVKLVAYPFRYGDSLYWYDEENGRIKLDGYPAPGELVRVRTKNDVPLHFHASTFPTPGGSGSNRSVEFSSQYMVFDSPILLAKDIANLESRQTPNGNVKLALTSETIFLDGLEIMHLPEYTIWGDEWETRESRTYGVELKLPTVVDENGLERKLGKQGRTILEIDPSADVDPDEWYGEVYFGPEAVHYQRYKWVRKVRWLIFVSYHVERDGNAQVLRRGTDPLSGHAFYFRDGAILSSASVALGDLVPIQPDNAISREYLEGLQPFFWEK